MLALYEYAWLHLSAILPNHPYYKDSLFQCFWIHKLWMHSLKDPLSKGRTNEASSKGCLVQERPCPGDASSKGRIIRDSVFGDTTFGGKGNCNRSTLFFVKYLDELRKNKRYRVVSLLCITFWVRIKVFENKVLGQNVASHNVYVT